MLSVVNHSMYSASSRYYDLIYASKDYATEAKAIVDLIISLSQYLIKGRQTIAKSVLDMACGSGKHCRYFAEAEF